MARVKSFASPKLVMVFLALSVLMTASGVPFWDEVVVSGAHVWVFSSRPGRRSWSIASQYLLEVTSGFAMTAIFVFLVVYRWPELRQAWKIHRRIRFYFGLTLTTIVANLGLGLAGTLVVVQNQNDILMMFAFSCRNTHIALDTIVLYRGLGTTWFNIEGSSPGAVEAAINQAGGRPMIDAAGSHSGTHSPSERKSSADGIPPLGRTVPTYIC